MSGVHKIQLKNLDSNIYYQNNSKLFLELVQLINENPYKYVVILTSKCTKRHKDYSYLCNWIDNMVPQLSQYNYATKCYWIIYGLTDFPVCKNEKCSNKIIRTISFWVGHHEYCCIHCQVTSKKFKEQRQKTWRANLGVDYPTQSKQVIKTRQNRNLKKYGVVEPCMLDEVKKSSKNTRYTKYDGKFEPKESLIKRQQTNLKQYGHICNLHGQSTEEQVKVKWKTKYHNGHPLSDPRIRQLGQIRCLEKYGVNSFSKSNQFQELWKDEKRKNAFVQKQLETKRKNNSFHISKVEFEVYQLLQQIFPNLKKQYKSIEYPFLCDFYDPDSSTYIELNAHWTHGKHFFNKDDPQDLAQLANWREKAKTSKFYKNAIETWTVRDVKKLATAREKCLKYLVFWSIKEVKTYISNFVN